jgi:hypothetical protein
MREFSSVPLCAGATMLFKLSTPDRTNAEVKDRFGSALMTFSPEREGRNVPVQDGQGSKTPGSTAYIPSPWEVLYQFARVVWIGCAVTFGPRRVTAKRRVVFSAEAGARTLTASVK